MRLLGNVFIGLGVLLCLTIIGVFWGLPFIAIGALLRIAGRPVASPS